MTGPRTPWLCAIQLVWPRGFNGEETGVPARRIRTTSVIISCAALALGGCSATGPRAVWATPGAPAAASPSPAPSSPAPDQAAMQRKATAAAIAPGALAAIGGAPAPKRDEQRTFLTTDVCGQRIAADASVHVSRSRTWSSVGLFVQNTTQVYAGSTGADAVAQVKAAAEGCHKYPAPDGERTILGPVNLPQYPKTEARFGFCYQTKATKGPDYLACSAYLAKGNVLSSTTVIRGTTRQTSTDGLLAVGSIAADALVKAA
jgi:hypothetical protein